MTQLEKLTLCLYLLTRLSGKDQTNMKMRHIDSRNNKRNGPIEKTSMCTCIFPKDYSGKIKKLLEFHLYFKHHEQASIVAMNNYITRR